RVNWLASRQPPWPHCQSISRACSLTCRGLRFSRPSFAFCSSSQNSESLGLIAPITASCSCFCTSWMTSLRSCPSSFPGKDCILIVLIVLCCRCDFCSLVYHLFDLMFWFF